MRRGRFEQADGGTLFLDEIGDMPFELQTRLLRVLSDGHFYRVGGHSAIKTQVRVIAATHQNLEQRVKDGVFREDLFHRLNVIRLRLPALRERKEDIAMLTRHFLQKSAQQLGGEPKRLSDAAVLCLENFQFPGNVRQLENICHWLTVMAPTQVVEPKDLPPEVGFDSLALAESNLQNAIKLVAASAHPAGDTGNLATAFAVSETAAKATIPGASVATTAVDTHAVLHSADPLGSLVGWESAFEQEARALLASGRTDVWDALLSRVESRLIHAALTDTKGRRIEAAHKLGIGRNTITRKIQELGLE